LGQYRTQLIKNLDYFGFYKKTKKWN
jgi:hypothetical protein